MITHMQWVHSIVRNHSFFIGRGDSGGHPNVFVLKGEGIPKIEGGRANICFSSGWRGPLKIFKRKLGGGGHQYFSEIKFKNLQSPYP